MSSSWKGFYSKKLPEPLGRTLKDGIINQSDYILINDFITEMTARNQLSTVRVTKLVSTILGWKKSKLIKSGFADLTMRELYTGINNLNTIKNQKGRPYAQNTKHDYIVILKRFLIWMVRNGYNKNLKEMDIRDIKNPSQNNDTTHPDQILDPNEILAMISACNNSRDRALIAVHYEAATRIGEMGRLRWRDIIWDEFGANLLITDTKTKKVRRARITEGLSAKYLATWKNDYPGTPEGDVLVFISDRGHPITYWGIRKAFLTAAERAGIQKHVMTHLFRKSRGTHLIEQGLPLTNMVEMMWGNQGTKQVKTYIRISPIEQDRVMLRHAGVITEEESKKQERRITARMCPNCHTQNTPTARFCNICAHPLTDAAKSEVEIAYDIVKSSPQYQALMALKQETESKMNAILESFPKQK